MVWAKISGSQARLHFVPAGDTDDLPTIRHFLPFQIQSLNAEMPTSLTESHSHGASFAMFFSAALVARMMRQSPFISAPRLS